MRLFPGESSVDRVLSLALLPAILPPFDLELFCLGLGFEPVREQRGPPCCSRVLLALLSCTDGPALL